MAERIRSDKQSQEQRDMQSAREQGLQRPSGSQRSALRHWDPFDAFRQSPFSMMRRMQEEMDELFGRAGFGRDWMTPFGRQEGWSPAIEAFQRGNEFVVRADVPGLTPEDLTVEIGDEALTIRGERRHDHEEEREGIFRSERAYGSFTRVVPLPEGAVADSAKANFANGVLEVVMQAPPHEVRRGRRIEISEGRSEGARREKERS